MLRAALCITAVFGTTPNVRRLLNEEMSIYVRHQGHKTAVDVAADATVADILRNINPIFGVPSSAEKRAVCFAGETLPEDKALSDAGICAESVVDVTSVLMLEFTFRPDPSRQVQVAVPVNGDIIPIIKSKLSAESAFALFDSWNGLPWTYGGDEATFWSMLMVGDSVEIRLVSLTANDDPILYRPLYASRMYNASSGRGLYQPKEQRAAYLQVEVHQPVMWTTRAPNGYGFLLVPNL